VRIPRLESPSGKVAVAYVADFDVAVVKDTSRDFFDEPVDLGCTVVWTPSRAQLLNKLGC